MRSGYQLANCSIGAVSVTCKGVFLDDIKVLSYLDYFKTRSSAYVKVERTFLVRKTKEFMVFSLLYISYISRSLRETIRELVSSGYVWTHVNLSDIFSRVYIIHRISLTYSDAITEIR